MSKLLPFSLILGLAATAAFAQTAPTTTPQAPGRASLSFEVATIKPAPPLNPMAIAQGKLHVGMKIDAARVDIGYLAVGEMIMVAYKVKRHQLVAPDWAFTERFDILAKMPEGANKDQVPEMLQTLLADRFGLKFHRESKEQAVYALVVGKGGHKMKDAPPEEEAPKPAADAQNKDENGEPKEPPKPAPPPGKGGMVFEAGGTQARVTQNADGKGATVAVAGQGQIKMSMGENGTMRMEFTKLNMEAFAELLTRLADRPVIDKTELKGNYQVPLEMTPDMMRGMAARAGMGLPMGPADGGKADAAPTAADPSGTLFSTVQQLGLRLDGRKLPIDTIIVDHLEKTPTEN